MEASRLPDAAPYSTFTLKRSIPIESLDLMVEEYEHNATGATHLHLSAESTENVFLVALRTVPEDSTGVAHILEHTALCGSERFPVRDPFFMMLRRSLNTFMNAFTSSDWTAYPFATQNRKDFENLLSVYLDAVFFATLDPLDFAQEGHRIEFDGDDPESADLVYKGVVFNEMKGAMSSTSSVLWDRLCFELFPTNTYHFNSGGDPEAIPELTYQQLRDFYSEHYHPSNAIFLTFGDIPAREHQQTFEELALSRFERSDKKIEVTLEQPFQAPRQAKHVYALDSDEEPSAHTHLILGWKLGESTNLMGMLEAQLVSSILMENSASPLMKFLETTDLGSSPSALCGVEDSMREMVFACGIEGSEADHAASFEQHVMTIIRDTADSGVDHDRVEAILHQIELHQREVGGDGMPYGLNLMLRALGAATHYGDPVAALDLEPAIDELRRRIQDPDYVPHLLHSMLLDNPHRVLMIVEPDLKLTEQRVAAEKARLASIKTELDDREKVQVLDLAEKLKARQAQQDDPNLLPRVELSDIPAELPEPAPQKQERPIQRYAYEAGTNGLVYQQVAMPLPAITEQQLQRLPLLTGVIADVGLGTQDYLTVQDRHTATVGSLGAATLTRSSLLDEQEVQSWLLLSSKALGDRFQAQVDLMAETLSTARFDELPRLKELVSHTRSRKDQSITGNGHALAMTAATAGMSPIARNSHQSGGLEGIRRLRSLDDSLKNPDDLQALGDELQQLHGNLLDKLQPVIATISDSHHLADAHATATNTFSALTGNESTRWQPSSIRESRREIWVANTQVNFCAKAYPTVPTGHADAAALTVLAAFLRNGFLHRTIREQGGAYGGGASQDGNIAAFRFFSYRDPRLSETLDDFDDSIRWLLESSHQGLALEEAILGIIGSLDKPASPAGEAKKHFHDTLFGRTSEQRKRFRQRIVTTTLDDLRRVAETYLKAEAASIAVVTSTATAEKSQYLVEQFNLVRQELV
ncbi:peptidase M16C associated domain protein [Luminiphilus syltensis NOR5-1B]|uniref:Peptidase M16C associated domain protein n=1 Tax=Luminiphilus syltensis NOR5-1B TaxID=565045 RepID=B8KXL2_9GAMM|nr:insulinase family protein [Luminiphilus syltensis]EED36802.1 peptidase M16C associated domain protein [Luminiphilus syltensis NOR5-1B]